MKFYLKLPVFSLKKIKLNIPLCLIIVVGFTLRIYYALLDPFLHEWDERFHALVARNVMNHPLKPMLHANPLIPTDPNSWCCSQLWLHKQPLFMWQMAISMKIFGVSEFTMRLPSVLMGTIMIFLIYRITFTLTNNKTTSLLASTLLCFSHYQLEQTSGLFGMDHNDVAFTFYILASIWAFAEKTKEDKLLWNILIGLFAGMAIMNKWLTGFIVFLPWGLLVLHQVVMDKKVKELKSLSLAFVICLLTFMPWQLFILSNYHDTAMYEYQYNNKHIWEVVENHTGSILFYVDHFKDYFGEYLYLFLYVGLLISLFQIKYLNKNILFVLLTSLLSVLFFFSFIVRTKLPSYAFIVAPIGMIFIAITLSNIFKLVHNRWGIALSLLPVIWFSLNPLQSIQARKNNPSRDHLIANTRIYKSLSKTLPTHVSNIINMNSFEDIDVMFYNQNLSASHWWIDVKCLDSLAKQKIWIGAFKNHGYYNLPPEFYSYPYFYLIDTTLK